MAAGEEGALACACLLLRMPINALFPLGWWPPELSKTSVSVTLPLPLLPLSSHSIPTPPFRSGLHPDARWTAACTVVFGCFFPSKSGFYTFVWPFTLSSSSSFSKHKDMIGMSVPLAGILSYRDEFELFLKLIEKKVWLKFSHQASFCPSFHYLTFFILAGTAGTLFLQRPWCVFIGANSLTSITDLSPSPDQGLHNFFSPFFFL